VVNLIENWNVLELYTGEKIGFYQLFPNGDKVEIRVMTGKIGFRKEFSSTEDPELTRILEFCRKRFFIRVSEHKRDEDFFK